MPIKRFWLVAVLLAPVAIAFGAQAASGPDFSGVWLLRHRATFMGQKATDSEDAKDHKAIQIIQDYASGKVTMAKPKLTPEMLALGYEAFDLGGFTGSVSGDAAVGTGARWIIWASDAECGGRPAGLRFREARKLEYIAAIPTDKHCVWTFSDFADYWSVQHTVVTLEPLFVVREVRYVDQAGNRIAKPKTGQTFRLEAEFEVPPPAPVYAVLKGRNVKVRPTAKPDVFQSDLFTLGSSASNSGR